MSARAKRRRMCLAAVVFLLPLWRSLSMGGELTSLDDVNLIMISPHVEGSALVVDIFYENEDQQALVFWKTGHARCQCDVYELVGCISDRNRGDRIAHVITELKAYNEDVSIHVPPGCLGQEQYVIIECTVDAADKKLSATNDFLLK